MRTGAPPTTSRSARSTSRQPAAARAAHARAHQAAAARPLGHDARAQLRLRPLQPRDQGTYDLDAIYVIGPGHGGPAHGRQRVPRGHLQRGLPEHLARTRRAWSGCSSSSRFPGGIPSHVAPETPGSIHEGGELGYALSHAYGAAFDNPDLLVCCVVGDGEAETGPLATSWHSNKFLNPATRRRRAADPAPERLQDRRTHRARADPRGGARRTASGLRLPADVRRGRRSRARCTSRWPRRSTQALDEIREIQHAARDARRCSARPALADDRAAHAQGLDGPEGGGRRAGRGHVPRAPGAARRRAQKTRAPRACSRTWMRSYRPEELFDETGRLVAGARRRSRPQGDAPHERQPARQRRAAAARPRAARLPRLRRRRAGSRRPRRPRRRACWARSCATSCEPQSRELPRSSARTRPTSNRWTPVFEVTDRVWMAEIASTTDDHLAPDGRVMEVL